MGARERWVARGQSLRDHAADGKAGGLRDDGVMEIRTAPGLDGSVRRMTFSNIEPDGFDWEWAASTGDGFAPMWTLRYTRTGG